MKHRSIHELFRTVAREHRDEVGFHHKRGGRWVGVTWREQEETVSRISGALLALGIGKGERVAILSQTRLEWVQLDLGIVCAGAVTVGVYPSNLGPDCAYIVEHSDSEVVFAEDRTQLDKLLAVRASMPRVRQIVLIEGATEGEEGVLGWEAFLALATPERLRDAEVRAAELRPEDLASLVYTSGTTGLPKGVMLTHGNLIFTTGSAAASLRMGRGYTTLAFLPLAHVFARLISYCCLAQGVEVWFAESMQTVARDLQEVRPHFITSVPRIYEKVHDKVVATAHAAGGLKLRIFDWALDVGLRVSHLTQRGEPVPWSLRLRYRIADRLVLHKVRNAFGGRLEWAVSGAAPLNVAIAEFFHACGVLVLEGIGMTENTSFSHVNRYHANRFGTVGQPGPGVEVRIAPDGEVLFRGPNVMRGYFKDPEATAEAIDADGWLHSGDIGEIDADGYLKITDRKKDLIITAGGKNIAPQRIERTLRTSRYISHAVAYGDRRKYVTALISLDAAAIGEWAGRNGLGSAALEELAEHPRVRELIEGEIERCNRELASFETVKRFHILPKDLSIEDGDLTPTLKIRRKVVVGKHAAELARLYEGD